MRALVLHWGRTGGGPRFAVDAVAALEQAGVWTAYSSSLQSERVTTDRTVGAERLPVRTFSSPIGFALGGARAVANGRALRSFVERERIDCVFAAMEQLWQPAAATALRRSPTPYLLGLHDGTFHSGEESRTRAIARRLELAGSDGVLTFSRSAMSEFLRTNDFPSERLWTSFLPAKANRPSPAERRDVFRFGFFGRLLPYKGLGLLLDAVVRLRVSGQPFEVEVWGSGSDPALDAAVLPPEVRVERRWVPEEEIESVLARFDAVVAPYVDASQSGVIPLAASLGVPALITPVGGLTEQVTHELTGLVAEAVDADAFARLMQRALASPSDVRRLGSAAAKQSSEEQSVGRFGAELRAAMGQLITLGKRRAA